MKKILVIDIGGSKIIVGLADFDGNILNYEKFELPKEYDIDFLIDKICKMSENIKGMLEAYAKEVSEGVMKTDFDAMTEIVNVLLDAKERKSTVFTAGNGGSAATASHICNDLLKGCNVCNKNGFIAECLADSTAVVTCLANDFDYESIFSIQLETKANKSDILILYSGSGNSANILKAVKFAKENEMTVIGFTGRDGGKLAHMCDISVIAPTNSMEQIEDYHMIYVHSISDTLQKVLKEKYN